MKRKIPERKPNVTSSGGVTFDKWEIAMVIILALIALALIIVVGGS